MSTYMPTCSFFPNYTRICTYRFLLKCAYMDELKRPCPESIMTYREVILYPHVYGIVYSIYAQ